jgi:hypothetical protein
MSKIVDAVFYAKRWVVVTGVRDPDDAGRLTVRKKLAEIVAALPAGIIFGGARGVDTIALCAAGVLPRHDLKPRRVVIVPGRTVEQPMAACYAIETFADEVIELRGDLSQPSSFHARNARMLVEAVGRDAVEDPAVVAFLAPGVAGGTRATVERARRLGLTVEEVPVTLAASGVD